MEKRVFRDLGLLLAGWGSISKRTREEGIAGYRVG